MRLLAEQNLITLADRTSPRLEDIRTNPRKLRITPMEAAQLPRVLTDVDLAVINTVFAIPAGLSPRQDGLFMEAADSPYANIIAVRTADKEAFWVELLIKAVQSPEVAAAAARIFAGQAIPAWGPTDSHGQI